MILADLGTELAAAIEQLVAAGHLPATATTLTAAGTWRPALARPAPGAPGDSAPGGRTPDERTAAWYATSLPFGLARLAGEEPAAIAARLGRALVAAEWITLAQPTGTGYLTIGVSAAALDAVAVRIARAGPASMHSDALRGVSFPVRPLPDLSAGPAWLPAWRDQAAALTGRLALAAGATASSPTALASVSAATSSSPAATGSMPPPPPLPPGCRTSSSPAATASSPGAPVRPGASVPGAGGSVAEAVAWAGADAVRYWLARLPAARAAVLDDPASAALRTGPPGSAPPFPAPPALGRDLAAVRFACADAAATTRWAAELGLAPDTPLPPGHLGHPAQVALLTQLSWLAERAAGAARRGQPAELPRYLERLARAWLDCRESCPALPFGGQAAPSGGAGSSARLWLAAATRTALAAGLDLIGVGP